MLIVLKVLERLRRRSAPAPTECCNEARTCELCGRALCETHGEEPVRCLDEGSVFCADCHSGCTSRECWPDEDPDAYYDNQRESSWL